MSETRAAWWTRLGLTVVVPAALVLVGCTTPPGDPGTDPAPSAPAGLTATAGDGVVALAWDANSESDLDRYNVYQAPVGGAFAEIGEAPAGTEAFDVDGLVNGTTYRFAVDAEDGAGQRSPRSAEVSATPQGGQPQGCSPPAGDGTLDLEIVAAAGVAAAVQILGDGVDTTVTASGQVALASGRYLLLALRDDHAPEAGETIGRTFGVVGATVTEVCLEPDVTAEATVTYALQPASGRVWVSNDLGHSIVAFTEAQLAVPGSPAADVVLDLEPFGFSDPKQIAFDPLGNLWVADFNPARLFAFTPDQLQTSGTPTPALVITSSALSTPWGLAFDADGTLWVSDWQKDALLAFEWDTLVALLVEPDEDEVELDPDRTVVGVELVTPEFIAFDAAGSLWVASNNPQPGNGKHDRLLAYGAAQLAASGAPVPEVILEGDNGVLIGATGVVFDAAGDLWAMDVSGFMRFDAAKLVSGSPTPDFDADGLSVPGNLAFDADGRLWIAHEGQDELRLYTPGDGGNGVSWITSADLSDPQHLAFYPPPADLPIY